MKYQESYIDYIKELADEERYPFPLDFDYDDFVGLIAKIQNYAAGINIPQDAVPSSTYWLIKDEDIIGVTNLRHFLNEKIAFCGGHIGLGVRPSRRGVGVGDFLMASSIGKLNAMGVKSIHIHCYKNNLASSCMIIANGGKLVSEFTDNEMVIQRYVVNDT